MLIQCTNCKRFVPATRHSLERYYAVNCLKCKYKMTYTDGYLFNESGKKMKKTKRGN